jgi:hypothetical protein
MAGWKMVSSWLAFTDLQASHLIYKSHQIKPVTPGTYYANEYQMSGTNSVTSLESVRLYASYYKTN